MSKEALKSHDCARDAIRIYKEPAKTVKAGKKAPAKVEALKPKTKAKGK